MLENYDSVAKKRKNGKDKNEYKDEAFTMASKFGDSFLKKFNDGVKKCSTYNYKYI